MANKTIDMQKIHTVLRLYQCDYSFRAISQQTGILEIPRKLTTSFRGKLTT
jgi:hypothetical protein